MIPLGAGSPWAEIMAAPWGSVGTWSQSGAVQAVTNSPLALPVTVPWHTGRVSAHGGSLALWQVEVLPFSSSSQLPDCPWVHPFP